MNFPTLLPLNIHFLFTPANDELISYFRVHSKNNGTVRALWNSLEKVINIVCIEKGKKYWRNMKMLKQEMKWKRELCTILLNLIAFAERIQLLMQGDTIIWAFASCWLTLFFPQTWCFQFSFVCWCKPKTFNIWNYSFYLHLVLDWMLKHLNDFFDLFIVHRFCWIKIQNNYYLFSFGFGSYFPSWISNDDLMSLSHH